MPTAAAGLGPEVSEQVAIRKFVLVGISLAASALPFGVAFWELAHQVLTKDGYSHIPVVPLVSAWFLWKGRHDLKLGWDRGSRFGGSLVIVLGGLLYAAGWILHGRQSPWHLTVWMLSLVCVWIAIFVFACGPRAIRNAVFPLGFLLLLVPLPDVLLQSAIRGLQHASAAMTYWGFHLIGIPVYREGFVFTLPKLKIEIAEQCSGIRSSIVLMLTTLIMAQLSLRSNFNKFLLVAAAVPIAVFKNALRIISLSLLSIYVDPSFMTGDLHHRGGVVFFALAVVVVFGLTEMLRHFEAPQKSSKPQAQVGASSC